MSGLDAYDDLMRAFFTVHRPQGGALAVAYRGRLVYAKGFGWADPHRREQVQPDSLFRLASVSKPITAVAVLKLVEQGRIGLDQAIIPALNLPYLSGSARNWHEPRLAQITVRHCLRHTAGFDQALSGDPCAMSDQVRKKLQCSYPLDRDDLIRFALQRPLDFLPGERYAYSNVGYLMLGRLIEQVAGQRYEDFVRREIFDPLNIQQILPGKTKLADKAPGEVQYLDARGRTGPDVLGLGTDQHVPFPYGIDRIENLLAAGGWIGSAIDVVRFASGLFFPPEKPVLGKQILAEMMAAPKIASVDEEPPKVYYGCGWQVRLASGQELPATLWHTGNLAGVSTLLVMRADGVCWAVLFNQDLAPDGKPLADHIDPLLHRPPDAVEQWPDGNLFKSG